MNLSSEQSSSKLSAEEATLYYADLVNEGADEGGLKGFLMQVAGYAGGLASSLVTPEVFEAGGIPIVANELTFGLTDWVGITSTEHYQDTEHQAARFLAGISRELLLAAATGGTANAAAGGALWAKKTITGLRLYEAGMGGVSIGKGLNTLKEGDHSGWLQIVTGLAGIGFSFQRLNVVSLPDGPRKLKLPMYHDVAWDYARKGRNAMLITAKGKKIMKGMSSKNQWTWEHLFVSQKVIAMYPSLRWFGNSYANTFLRISSSLNSKLNNPALKWKLRGLVLLGYPSMAYSSYVGTTALINHFDEKHSFQKGIRVK